MICKICESEVNCIDGVFVCEEGHVQSYTQEVIEYATQPSGTTTQMRGASITLKKSKRTIYTFHSSYKKILILYTIFQKSKPFFSINSDLFFSLFVSLFNYENKEVNDFGLIDKSTFFLLVYFTKKYESEKKNEIVLFNEFFHFMLEFPFEENLTKVCLNFNKVKNEHLFKKGKITFKDIYQLICKLNELEKENLTLEQRNALNKIYTFCQTDMKTYFKYLKSTLSDFSSSKDSKLIFYFRKFVYYTDKITKIIIPDLFISIFLCEFFILFNYKLNYKRILNDFLERMNNLKKNFIYVKGENIKILTKDKFIKKIKKEFISRDSLIDLVCYYCNIDKAFYDKFVYKFMISEFNYN